ncbi:MULTISPECIES: hypothetical protein [Bacillus]|uniref:hypothetical protein n=1 Tax=Bacillus TaxID=1386 RepID=UPI00119CDB8A|nr:hypothetical protein [Bacillus cereus]MCU5061354.1 hypothetical protein [Bacillus cereus]MCU5145527.1 hypothetical protein [Bacillus cereus]MCU5640796.1 hypothetical protein [Bacillus cereus]HDR7002941.1 hypothetical protein [Bacillus cereus]HDR7021423.1 hypothetical protein [Bacillus cereus]
MDVNEQILVTLLLILVVQCLMHIAVIMKLKSKKKLKIGPRIGENIKNLSYEKNNQAIKNLYDDIKETKNIFIFLDLNCKECNKLFYALDAIKKEYLNNVRLILIEEDYNLESIEKNEYKNQIRFMKEETIMNELEINAFPFLIQVNNEGELQDKNYIGKSNLMQYIV